MSNYEDVEKLKEELYSLLSPVDIVDAGLCYYCGCESGPQDVAPPLDWASYFIISGESCDFLLVPCCVECNTFLNGCLEGEIDKRKIVVNKKLEKKYRKALKIYESWDLREIENVGVEIASMVKAGLSLGEEAYKRLKFSGFDYEVNGNRFKSNKSKEKEIIVFGEKFFSFREALQNCARSYGININVLKEWLRDNDFNFEVAIESYHEDVERKRVQREKEKLCKEFALKHKQNSKFVIGTLDVYCDLYPDLSFSECLQLIYEERVDNKI